MLMLVSYDVATSDMAGKQRLRRIAKLCMKWGIRVQYSVFECNVNPMQWLELKTQLESIFDPNVDSLRYYNLGDKYMYKIEHIGAKPAIDVENTLLF